MKDLTGNGKSMLEMATITGKDHRSIKEYVADSNTIRKI